MWRAGVALQATVENIIIRDFVWEIYYWDLRTLNNAKPYFFLNEMNKKVLPAIYSAAVWCLFVVLLFFWLYCVTTVTPFIERSEGWSLPSVGVLDQSLKKCRFFRRNSNPLQIFQLQPKKETCSSSLRDRLKKKSIISSSNRAICAGLRGKSGFSAVPVTTVALTKVSNFKCKLVARVAWWGEEPS